MRPTSLLVLALVAGLVVADSALAGVYHPAEPEPVLWPVPSNFEDVKKFVLPDLLQLGDEASSKHPLRQRYLKRVDELEGQRKGGTLSAADRVNLSGCYLRLGKIEAAVQVVEEVPEEQRDSLMLSNLATAHQLAERFDRAVYHLRLALKKWPVTWPGFTPEQLRWYRRAERYHLALLEIRRKETLQPGKEPDTLYELFSKVQLVGRSGRYEAGELAPEQWDALPPDALPLVTQLVLWLPRDNRLYWLLGEMYNATGNVAAAEAILSDLVYRGAFGATKEIKAHRQVLREALARLPDTEPVTPPVVQPAAKTDAPSSPAEKPLENSAPQSWTPDWRQVGVGFLAGVLVAVFAQLQVREIRRRRLAGAGRG